MNLIARKLPVAFLAVSLSVFLVACAALGLDRGVKVTLNGIQEVPAVDTSASGNGKILVAADKSVSGSITTSGVAVSAAHIHQGAAGTNGPVIIGLVKTGDNVWAVPAGAKFTDAQYTNYLAGNMYINVHSAAHKSGEIRGQINPK
ncbi:MAG: CHRD domain-containing protein [Burkholderiales bacterium]